MPRHMRFPRHCGKCPTPCGRQGMLQHSRMLQHSIYHSGTVEYMRSLDCVVCPLISTRNVRYINDRQLNDIDWSANGWPEPAPFDMPVDTSNMPGEVFAEWYRQCDALEAKCRNT